VFTREDDLLTVGRVRRSEIQCAVIGELELTRSIGVARPNLGVVSVPVRIGDPLAIRRVGRVVVVPIVVGYFGLTGSLLTKDDLRVPMVARRRYRHDQTLACRSRSRPTRRLRCSP